MGILSVFLGLVALVLFWIPVLGQLIALSAALLAGIDWWRARADTKAGRPRTALLAGVGLGFAVLALLPGTLILMLFLSVFTGGGAGGETLLPVEDISRF